MGERSVQPFIVTLMPQQDGHLCCPGADGARRGSKVWNICIELEVIVSLQLLPLARCQWPTQEAEACVRTGRSRSHNQDQNDDSSEDVRY